MREARDAGSKSGLTLPRCIHDNQVNSLFINKEFAHETRVDSSGADPDTPRVQ
jgi:hypothetical protein